MADTMGSPEIDAADVRLNRLLNLILETAVEALGFSAATISVRQQAEVSTVGATDQRLIELDDAQYQAGGPCVQTLDDHDPVLLRDVADGGETWEHYADTAAHLGVRARCRCTSRPTRPRSRPASISTRERCSISRDRQIRSAETYAAQLAATLQSVDAYRATANLARNMAEAMRSRAVIEQAKGILMADERIDEEEAFERLVALSQHANVKVRDVARRLVDERSRPQ